MTAAGASTLPPPMSRCTGPLLVLFALSGAAALVYELVWFHLLRLAVGSSSISLAFLLGSFMGGMCLGSLLAPRLLPRHWHPLRVYALLELGIAALGAIMPWLLPLLGRFYTEHGGYGGEALAFRAATAALALLPPTMLMGATLPAIARWLDASPMGLSRLGWFYGANITGAVLGVLGAGFWLLPMHDVAVATWVAVGTNVAVALFALVLAARRAAAVPQPLRAPAAALPTPATRATAILALVAITLSGLTALGAEVVWTRLLTLLLGATVYTFSLILAVFLVGLGLGTTVGARLARNTGNPAAWLGGCLLAIAPCIAWAAFAIARVIPWAEPTWVFQPHVYQNMLVHHLWDCGRCALTLLPAAMLWGAAFPLALAAANRGGDPGRTVGGLYAANTIGAIAGALVVGLFAIHGLGTQRTQQALAVLAGLAGVSLLASHARPRARLLAFAGGVIMVTGAVTVIPQPPDGMIAFGRHVADWDADVDFRWVGEGRNASVAVSESTGFLNFHVSGKVVASTEPLDMRLQRLLGHLPSLVHGAPRSVLVVGCGAGVTAGCFVDYPSVERIVICEIEPLVADAAREWLGLANRDVLRDPRTEVIVDDARHYLATTKETFDIITSDPIHPWVRGAAALYSSEYHELVRAHLNPGGLITQWVPLYQSDAAAVKSQVGTFCRAFPATTIWSSDLTHKGYDIVLLAGHEPLRIDVDAVQARIDDDGLIRAALEEVDLGSAVRLLSAYCTDAESLRDWLADAQLNVDASLRLQYLAGLALDLYLETEIYAAMKATRRWPDWLFTGSDDLVLPLQQLLAK